MSGVLGQDKRASARVPWIKRFQHLGREVCMRQLAAETGIPMRVLYQRWHRGDRGERLVRPAVRRVA